MSQVMEFLRGGAVALLSAGDPTLVFGVAGAFAGALMALGLALACRRLLSWRSGGRVRVASLAARGVTRAEIARRTGLSQDAVGMLLCVRSARRGRRNLPAPARIAASRRADARGRNRDWNPQTLTTGGVSGYARIGSGSARPLPSAPSTFGRLTRSGRAA